MNEMSDDSDLTILVSTIAIDQNFSVLTVENDKLI